MPRKRRRRPNWGYRAAWLALLLSLAVYIGLETLVLGLTEMHRSYGTDWSLAFVSACLDATLACWFFAVGASIGSFLNVVVYRLPRGKNIGGHSSCPYCSVPIRGSDNIPILAWIRLRGRCRVCRLPISPQYPLVELLVALLFLAVYVTEIATGGANLPVSETSGGGSGLLRMRVTATLVFRSLAYLITLSGLVSAGLIVLKGWRVPFKLYFALVVPLILFGLLEPGVSVLDWRTAEPAGPVEARLDFIATWLSGMVAGLTLARLLAPILYPGVDPRLLSSDASTAQARQWMGAMAVVGGLLGWQAVVPVAWAILVVALIGLAIATRVRENTNLRDMTAWTWGGLFSFRIIWGLLAELPFLPEAVPAVVQHVIGAVALMPVAWGFRNLSDSLIPASDRATDSRFRAGEEADPKAAD